MTSTSKPRLGAVRLSTFVELLRGAGAEGKIYRIDPKFAG